MTPRIALDNYYVIIACMIASCFSLYIALRIHQKASKSYLLTTYLITQGCLMGWTLAKVFKTVSPTLELRWFFIVVQFLAICALGISFLCFSYAYSKERILTMKQTVLISIPGILSLLIILTNPWHMMFYKTFDMFRDTFGPLFYVHQAIVYTYLIAGIFLCAKDFTKRTTLSRMASIMVACAVLFPLFINLLYVFKVLKTVFHIRLPMDITPISCMLSYSLFYLAVLRYRFLDVTPYAYNKAMDMSSDGLAIMSGESMLWSNKAYNDLSDHYDSGDAIDRHSTVLSSGRILVRLSDRRPLEDTIRSIESRQATLKEARHHMERHMEDMRELHMNLSLNHLARHVHDVLGHGMVIVINLLEVAALKVKNASGSPDECLRKAYGVLEESIDHLAYTETNDFIESPLISSVTAVPLQSYLHPLVRRLQLVDVRLEVIVQGSESTMTMIQVDNLHSICREAVTNAIRHGRASLIHIFIRWKDTGLDLHILDNGLGCGAIHENMGLEGMKKRAHLIGATLTYTSEPDSGFSIHLHMPSDQFVLEGIDHQLRPVFQTSQ